MPDAKTKSLDEKLAALRHDPHGREFILADAKDADMAFGLSATGPSRSSDTRFPYRSLAEFREQIREIVRQGLVDLMLMSASTGEILALDEGLFSTSSVTPAVRLNDSTDIWVPPHGGYTNEPSLPFQSATLAHIRQGHAAPPASRSSAGIDLGLYSITLNRDAVRDRETLQAYRDFRLDAESQGMRHFLEVFAPNAPPLGIHFDIPGFVNDSIVRLLAGVTQVGRPIFLKIPYFGPRALEALVHYDPSLIVGILGGTAGTTHDAFQLLAEAKRYGARAALFGRKINQAEDQLSFVRHLRSIADDQLEPAEAVRSYHAELLREGIAPRRSLDDDLRLTTS